MEQSIPVHQATSSHLPESKVAISDASLPGIGSRDTTGFRWMDLLWLALVGFLALLSPVREPHKQLILLAIGLFQIFDRRLLASVKPSRRDAYSVAMKIALSTFLIGHTDSNPAITSPYWLIYVVPVVSAAMVYEALGTLFWTVVAAAAYFSYLIPALREYELVPTATTDLAIRGLFLFLAAIIVNRFATDNRRQAERYRRLAETLGKTNRRLERAEAEVRRSERLAALGQLIAGVAHEIRNPLGVIRGSAEMLARKLSPSDALAGELAGNISSEADRLNGIVTRFLDFARPMRVRREPADLPAILDRALRAAENSRNGAEVKVERQYAVDLPPVRVDAELCEQVFSNLALNAFQAIGEQGGKLRVAVRPVDEGMRPGVAIEFEDTGPGVPTELREQIFNPFFTTKRDGVGLGLSIVAKIISEHGGSIRLASQPGSGACFRIFLPRD